MKSIPIDTLIRYFHESDINSGTYPESSLEGESVGIDILEFAMRDGIITPAEFEAMSSKLRELNTDID